MVEKKTNREILKLVVLNNISELIASDRTQNATQMLVFIRKKTIDFTY